MKCHGVLVLCMLACVRCVCVLVFVYFCVYVFVGMSFVPFASYVSISFRSIQLNNSSVSSSSSSPFSIFHPFSLVRHIIYKCRFKIAMLLSSSHVSLHFHSTNIQYFMFLVRWRFSLKCNCMLETMVWFCCAIATEPHIYHTHQPMYSHFFFEF